MLVLSIDTAGNLDSFAVIRDGELLAEVESAAKQSSLRDLTLNIDSVLAKAGTTLEELSGVAVGLGPGSWTGVRVGVTAGKMLAYATAKPVCGVSSLDALAYLLRTRNTLVCPIVDAGRGNVYAALYRHEGGELRKVADHSAGSIEPLLDLIHEPVIFTGNAVTAHRDRISSVLGQMASFAETGEQRTGPAIATLAIVRFQQGVGEDPLQMAPLYLREPLARALTAGVEAGECGRQGAKGKLC